MKFQNDEDKLIPIPYKANRITTNTFFDEIPK